MVGDDVVSAAAFVSESGSRFVFPFLFNLFRSRRRLSVNEYKYLKGERLN